MTYSILIFNIYQMRLINRNISSLHIWNVSEYIKQAQSNIIKQDNNHFITMQRIFNKLYMRHLRDHQKIIKQRTELNNFALMSQEPARMIAQHFHKISKQYSEELLKTTFQYLANTYQLSKSDHGGTLDSLGYKLFLTAQFGNLSEELKYGIRNNKINFNNLVSIINSLIKMEYIDFQIFNLLLLYTERQIVRSDQYAPLNNWQGDRQFQIQKKGYYNAEDIATLQALRNSQEVNTALSFVRHIYEEWQSEQKEQMGLKQENIKELNELIAEVSATNKNFRGVVEGIISIRRQYLKMTQFSSNQQILRDVNLNLELLLLEQKLLSIKLININDIKNSQQMHNADYQIKRVEQILVDYLDVDKLSPIFNAIDKTGIQVEENKGSQDPQSAKIAVLLYLLSKLASLDRHVYHTHDGRSLVNLKWEKTLIEQSSATYIPTAPYHEELKVSRIFRRIYSSTVQFFRKNNQKIHTILQFSPVNEKILIISAYCQLGMHIQAITQANQFQNDTKIQVSQLSKQNFVSLVHIFNDIGLFINNQDLKVDIFQRISNNLWKQENNQLSYGLTETIDVVNYLIQNHRNYPGFSDVYERYLGVLQSKALYFTPSEHQNENVVEAFKILALEKPQKYGKHPTYLMYVRNFVTDAFKKNPFHSILRQTSYKWCSKINQLNHMQPYLTLGINKGVQNSLIFSNSDESSLEGQIRTGNLNSYILRLEGKNNMNVHQFSVNSFLEINYEKQKIFRLKPKELLQQRFKQIFEYQVKPYDLKLEELSKSIEKVIEAYPECLISNKIKLKLLIIQKLKRNNFNIETKEQEYSNNALILLEVFQLNKLVSILDEKQILKEIPNKNQRSNVLNKRLLEGRKETYYDQSVEVDVNQIKSEMREMKNKFYQVINLMSEHLKEQLKINENPSNLLKGQRQTLQTLSQKINQPSTSLAPFFINYTYLHDKTFCQYKDWRQKISQKYNFIEFDIENVSNMSKILLNKFCQGVTNKLTYLPICKHSQRLKRLDLQFKLLKSTQGRTQTDKNVTSNQTKELDYIINMQNFKHELKTTFTDEELVDFIFGFKFILDLKKQRENRTNMALQRDPEAYFNFLEELNQRSYIQSPYAKYIIGKLSKTDRIRQLLEERKQFRISQKILYQKGAIAPQTYYQRVNELQEQIIKAIDQLKTKMLDHMDDMILDGEFKMLEIKKDELQAFELIIKKNFSYNRQFDSDFIYANGDYEKALNFKRGRAQRNYIKFYLLKKLADNQTMSYKELNILSDWKEQIIQDITSYQVSQKYSSMLISQLSWENLQSLKLKSSILSSNKDMLVIDLIMELNLFLDETLIENYERQVKAEHISQKYNIPRYLFDQSMPKGFRHIQNQVEQSIINESSKIANKDINTLEQIFKIFKTEGYKQRKRYEILCSNFRDNMSHMNQQIIRSQLIQEYIKLMEQEFMKQYNPTHVEDIKQKETQILWREIFHHPYEYCNRDLLKQITKKVLLRMELFKEKTPPFFGNFFIKLLMHPNLDALTKETLIAALQYNKFDLNIDSSDLETISKLEGRGIKEPTATKGALEAISNVKLSKQMHLRAKQLLDIK